jgi:pantothenate kinase
MIHEVDSRQFDTEVAEALRAATGELKAINDHLSLDEVAEIMDSAQEQIRITEEVSELLSQNLTFHDESLLEDELNGLMEPHQPVAAPVSSTTGGLDSVQVPDHTLPTTQAAKEGRTAVAM